jgi:cell division septation protein DedD
MQCKSLLFVLIPLCLACGSTERFLRPEAAFHVNTGTQLTLALPTEIKDSVSLRCIGTRSVKYSDGGTQADQCMYISADVTRLTEMIPQFSNKDNRNMIAALLLSVSDQNCQTFLARAFANKAGLDASNGIISDLATGGAAGTAAALPGISAGLSVANLIVGKTVGNFDKTYYAEKTFEAMESSILGERASRKAGIIDNLKKETTDYTIFDALGEVRQYDEACSIQRGLLKLSSIADNARADGEAKLKTAIAGTPQIGNADTGNATPIAQTPAPQTPAPPKPAPQTPAPPKPAPKTPAPPKPAPVPPTTTSGE